MWKYHLRRDVLLSLAWLLRGKSNPRGLWSVLEETKVSGLNVVCDVSKRSIKKHPNLTSGAVKSVSLKLETWPHFQFERSDAHLSPLSDASFSFIPSSLLALRWMFGTFVRNQPEPVRHSPRPTCHAGRCSPPEVWRKPTNLTFMVHLFTPVVSVAGVLPFLELTTAWGDKNVG